MAPKRNLSRHNVDAKRKRLESEMSDLVCKQDELQFAEDLKWVAEALRKAPSKMKSVKALLKLDEGVTFDSSVELSPDLIRRNITRLPMWFLRSVLLNSELLNRETLAAIIKTEARAGIHLLQRFCMLPATFAIFTNQQSDLLAFFKKRMEFFKATMPRLVLDDHFAIQWSVCGVYALKPAMSEEVEGNEELASKHVFTHIEGFMTQASLEGVYVIKGSWHIAKNYCPWEAELVCPHMPNVRPRCMQFFNAASCRELDAENPHGSCPRAIAAPPARLALGNAQAAAAEGALCDQEADIYNELGQAAALSAEQAVENAASSASSSSSPSSSQSQQVVRPPPPKKAEAAKAAMRQES